MDRAIAVSRRTRLSAVPKGSGLALLLDLIAATLSGGAGRGGPSGEIGVNPIEYTKPAGLVWLNDSFEFLGLTRLGMCSYCRPN